MRDDGEADSLWAWVMTLVTFVILLVLCSLVFEGMTIYQLLEGVP